MRVLITNLYVATYSGSEVVVELLADGLRRAGHTPMVLAPMLGPQADAMRRRGHVVVDRIAALPAAPDLIHAQHTTAAIAALAAFPATPAVFECHSALYEVEAPRLHPQIRRWIAVDDLCRERCLSRGVPAERLSVIANAVDLERFARRAPLPARPRRALLLTKNAGHHDAVRAACAEHGLALDVLGAGVGRVSDEIEHELPVYDLVFATARMALEAAAIGCAVVVCDGRGFAGLLTAERLDEWRRLNFGAGLLARPTSRALVSEAIAQFDAADGAMVTDRLRAEASLEHCVAEHLAVYATALADPAPTAAECAAATAAWVEELTPNATDRQWSVIARELFLVEAEPEAVALQAMEQRLAGEVTRRTSASAHDVVEAIEQRGGTRMQQLAEAAEAAEQRAGARMEQIVEAAEQRLAAEMSRRIAASMQQAAQAMEQRLAAEAAQRVAASTQQIAMEQRLRAELVQRIGASTEQIAQMLQDEMAQLAAQIAARELAERERRQWLRRIWRRSVPHALRAPLFRLRQWALRRDAGA